MLGEEFLIWFNNQFPHDRSYRKKYNIPFGSQQHKETSQIDVFLDSQEDKIYDKHIAMYKEEKKNLEEYKKTGKFLKDSDLGEKEFDELFSNFDVDSLNKKKE